MCSLLPSCLAHNKPCKSCSRGTAWHTPHSKSFTASLCTGYIPQPGFLPADVSHATTAASFVHFVLQDQEGCRMSCSPAPSLVLCGADITLHHRRAVTRPSVRMQIVTLLRWMGTTLTPQGYSRRYSKPLCPSHPALRAGRGQSKHSWVTNEAARMNSSHRTEL